MLFVLPVLLLFIDLFELLVVSLLGLVVLGAGAVLGDVSVLGGVVVVPGEPVFGGVPAFGD